MRYNSRWTVFSGYDEVGTGYKRGEFPLQLVLLLRLKIGFVPHTPLHWIFVYISPNFLYVRHIKRHVWISSANACFDWDQKLIALAGKPVVTIIETYRLQNISLMYNSNLFQFFYVYGRVGQNFCHHFKLNTKSYARPNSWFAWCISWP